MLMGSYGIPLSEGDSVHKEMTSYVLRIDMARHGDREREGQVNGKKYWYNKNTMRGRQADKVRHLESHHRQVFPLLSDKPLLLETIRAARGQD
jgi:hypothetical protein